MGMVGMAMDKPPIEVMLDRLQWEEIPFNHNNMDESIPYATHSGILKIAQFELKVFQLSNGKRVINADDLEAFFNAF
jgi:hypothetical protein